MLEDLVATRGARFVFMDKGWGALKVDEVSALLEQLARMHATWEGDPRLDSLAGFELPQREFMKYCIRDQHWEHVLQRPFGHRLASIFPDVTLAREALDRNWALNDAAPKTLLHGDPPWRECVFRTRRNARLDGFPALFCEHLHVRRFLSHRHRPFGRGSPRRGSSPPAALSGRP